MSELPPDPVRLRAILAYLDKQLADGETVVIYLRLQRKAVQDALARADGVLAPSPGPPSRNGHRPAAALPFAPNRTERQSTGFVAERQPRAIGAGPVRIHVDDCSHGGAKHPITANDARAALLDPNIEECPFCRPMTELGMLD
ncbi:DUF6233 domain-containing protein [Streptomyces sp. NPDC059010]|uniref:DUF6233 domain-containing protein n=1 Tax=Streptomyces sp. NPDC059010 TaxID=3346695 RepID=UPI0036C7A6F9